MAHGPQMALISGLSAQHLPSSGAMLPTIGVTAVVAPLQSRTPEAALKGITVDFSRFCMHF